MAVERGQSHSDDLLRGKAVNALSAPDRNLATALKPAARVIRAAQATAAVAGMIAAAALIPAAVPAILRNRQYKPVFL